MAPSPEESRKFFARLPENFYDMSEEEQLAWTRKVGEELAAEFGTAEHGRNRDEKPDEEAPGR